MPGPSNNPHDDATSAIPPGHSPHSLVTAPTAAVHTPAGSLHNPSPPPSSTAGGYATVYNPGDTLANRYRIVAKLGKGGMGEVYRADDLSLGAAVALKFLPPAFSADPVWVERFRSEVRLTRQISHPNVCRVYDIAELPGSPAGTPANSSPSQFPPRLFLAMEYIDGEDLAGLLRRIGRLPHDKAVQISRQICFGLAAAHEQGVIHRDLKPANIMLDGRGNARITDFGVAGLVEQFVQPQDVIVGTPAYMAPEQLAGREVSKRSDIYALGLVLYELFTGKRAGPTGSIQELRDKTNSGTRHTPTRPSELIADLDPAVERVILRCLEFDPQQRPPSAIAVAAALPGGDPLAAAIAAGETPSPELVARSGELGELSARAAGITLFVALALLGVVLTLGARMGVIARSPTPLPPDALAAKARELSLALDNILPPADEAFGFTNEFAIQNWLALRAASQPLDPLLASGALPTTSFWFRQSPTKLSPLGWWRRALALNDPPWRDPGHVIMALGPQGQLLRYSRVPYEAGFEPLPDSLFTPSNSDPVYLGPPAGFYTAVRAAGLDFDTLTPTAPLRSPSVGSDRRFAFIGKLTGTPASLGEIPVRIEAAALNDRLVTFTVMGPWDRLASSPAPSLIASSKVAEVISGILITIAIISALLLARLNIRKRRSDARGAFTLGAALFLAEFLAMILPRHSLGDILTFEVIGRPIGRSLWLSMLTVLLYIALEPFARKRNPASLIGWARLVTGDWKNPRVGRDLLLGITLGCALSIIAHLSDLVSPSLGDPLKALVRPDPSSLTGSTFVASYLFSPVSSAALLALLCTLMIVGLGYLFRARMLLVYPVAVLLMFIAAFTRGVDAPFSLPAIVGIAFSAALVFTLARIGILGAMAYLYTLTVLLNVPLVASLSTWTASPGLISLGAIAAIAAWAAYRASLGFQMATAAPAPQAA